MLDRIAARRLCICTTVVLLTFVLSRMVEIALVPTGSMQSTVLVGDHILINKLSYGPSLFGHRLPMLRSPRRGELLSLHAPNHPDVVYIKRVVAIGGDQIELRDGTAYVNSTPLVEPYAVHRTANPRGASMAPTLVPRNAVFVLGDNRDDSEDSRSFGVVPLQNVVGQPVLVCWSFANSWSEWLDDQGNLRLRAYWSVLRHPLARGRWARTGKLL